jgi:esterase/lipase
MAKSFYERGYNVVTILSPGHWEKDLYRMGKLDSKKWSREADIGWELAKQHGDKVILAGHSLGSLLNLEQSMKRDPEEIHGMAYWFRIFIRRRHFLSAKNRCAC